MLYKQLDNNYRGEFTHTQIHYNLTFYAKADSFY
jgi:hypothetical protein